VWFQTWAALLKIAVFSLLPAVAVDDLLERHVGVLRAGDQLVHVVDVRLVVFAEW